MSSGSASNAIVSGLLSWIKGLASWVLRLFNLGGGGSPLEWFSRHWFKLLVFFVVLGIAMDILVWMLRWRPHWVWFHRKRIIVNDERMLAGESEMTGELSSERPDALFSVPSTQKRSGAIPARRLRKRNTMIPRRETRATQPVRRRPVVRRVEPAEGDGDVFEISEGPRASVYSEDRIFNVKTLERRDTRRRDGNKGTLRTSRRRE